MPPDFSPTEWWTALPVMQKVAAIIVGGILVHVFVRVILLRALDKMAGKTDNDLDDRLVLFIRKFYMIFLIAIIAALLLRANNINITPLLASAGIMGIALGLAAKEALADILAGIFLITDRPIRIGDRVNLERIGAHWGSWGDVVDIGLRRTRIRNTDGVIVNYPNNVIGNSIISNFSYEDDPVRVRVRFQVNYDADLDQVTEVTATAIESCEGVLPDTADIVIRSLWDDDGGHALSGVLVEGRYRIGEIRDRTRIRSRVLQAILKSFHNAGIRMAEPTLKMGASTE